MPIKELENSLNKFLNSSGISKNALAKMLKISQSQVSNLANGKMKRWTENTKKIDDFIQEYYKNNFKIPTKIEENIKEILLKNSKNEGQILAILEAIKKINGGLK